MRSLFFLAVTLLVMSSCQNRSTNAVPATAAVPDTLIYKYKKVSKSTGPCKDTEGICARVEFSYPVFETSTGDSINRWIAQKLGAGYMDTMIHADYEEVMQQFLSGYEHMLKTMPDYVMPWEYKKDITVDRQLPGYVTLHISVYENAGGAHPNIVDSFYNYDLKNNKQVSVDEQLVDGGGAKLKMIAENIFRREFKLTRQISLDSAGFFFDNGKFTLPVNYTFTSDGIMFHYNDYEIRSHAEGPYDLTVPYDDIRDIAKPGSYLSGMIPAVL